MKFRERIKKGEVLKCSRRQQKIEKYFEKITPIKTKKRTREGDMQEAREDKRLRMIGEGDMAMEAAEGEGEGKKDLMGAEKDRKIRKIKGGSSQLLEQNTRLGPYMKPGLSGESKSGDETNQITGGLETSEE